MKTPLAALALAGLISGEALADACDQIRHDQLKYSECMANDPSRNRPSTPRYRVDPPPEEAPQENSYDRERRLKREAAAAEQKAREDKLRDEEIIRQRKEGAREKQVQDTQRAAALARVRKIRSARVAAVDDLAAKLSDPRFDTPETYDHLVTAAAPEADLMVQWARRGYARFPREFAFRYWLIMRSTCHAVKTEDKFSDGFSPSAPCMAENGAAKAALSRAALEGDLPDRALNCAYLQLLIGAQDDVAGAGFLSRKEFKDDNPKAQWAQTLERERTDMEILATCEKDLGDALPAVKAALFKTMWTLGASRKYDVLNSAVFGWMWRSRALWDGRTTIRDMQDPATVGRVIATADSLFNRRMSGE